MTNTIWVAINALDRVSERLGHMSTFPREATGDELKKLQLTVEGVASRLRDEYGLGPL